MMLGQFALGGAAGATAICSIKFAKIVVWDGGQEGGGAGGFVKNMAGSLPPALQIMKDIGGVEMPEYFGKLVADAQAAAPAAKDTDGDEEADAEDAPAKKA